MAILPFTALQALDLPLTEIVSGRIGFIHDLFLTFPYEVCETLPEGDQDLVVLIGKGNRGARIQELAEYPGRVVLVCAPGDGPLRGTYTGGERGLPPNIVAAYVTNNEMRDRRMTPVPLGVRINKLRALKFVRQNHDGRRGLLYGNFTLNDEHYRDDKTGARHIRAQLAEQLRAASWANLDVSRLRRDTPEGLIRYFSQIAGHRFVLSPEGSGIDCYRTWEALYLGAIPIVMVSPTMSEFSGLPMLFTEDYSELSEAYLEQCWQQMSERSFEIDRMLKSHYLRHFLNSVSKLTNPRYLCWRVGNSPSEKFIQVLGRSSRSASGVVVETPTPPFTGRRDLMTAADWGAPGRLRIEQVEGGLRAIAEGDGPGVVEIPLQTIAGAPFSLTGNVRPETPAAAALTVDVEERPEVIAAVEVGNENETALKLDFVARSDRTVLSIRAPGGESRTAWLVSDLSLCTNV